ncbi:MAG: hypothetical protein K2M64_03720 [Clostridia bacterium]|nr:hypothetical protein [Clostridia bacterium]
MDTIDNATKCTNCKYYKRHYIVAEGRFLPTAMGHCINSKVNNHASDKHIKKDEGCDLWQPFELQKLEFKYDTEQRLQNICDKLTDILAVLRDAE